jgi:hypothetical protein
VKNLRRFACNTRPTLSLAEWSDCARIDGTRESCSHGFRRYTFRWWRRFLYQVYNCTVLSNSFGSFVIQVKSTSPDSYQVHPHRAIINPYDFSNVTIKFTQGMFWACMCICVCVWAGNSPQHFLTFSHWASNLIRGDQAIMRDEFSRVKMWNGRARGTTEAEYVSSYFFQISYN